jgi:hypothetical protein
MQEIGEQRASHDYRGSQLCDSEAKRTPALEMGGSEHEADRE